MMVFLRKLSRLGVTDDLPQREVKHIVFLNFVTLLVFVIGGCTIAMSAFYLPATKVDFITCIIHIGSIEFALLWNHLRKHLFARVWFSVDAAVFLTVHTVQLGTVSGWHFFLAVCVFLLFYMFPPRDKVWMYALIAVFSACFVGCEIFFRGNGILTGIPDEYLLQLYYDNTLGVLFCALSMGGVGYVTIRNADDNLAVEHERSEALLRNILPGPIADRLKATPGVIADSFSDATIMFVDIVGFTKLSETMPPDALIALLNNVFSEIDDLTDQYALEKIKTIGDAYMVVAGAPERRPDHAEAMVAMSLEIKERFAKLNRAGPHVLDFRIGIHSGPVVAGVIGKKKFSYDMWGDTVNTAARMESHGIPGEIQVSARVRDVLSDNFLFVERGLVELKGKGEVLTYLLKGRRVQPS
jgi:class 3 adenylate cyclase